MSRTINIRTPYKIIGSDYSAQEPRMTAQLSQDPEMLKAYEEGKDLYAIIAQSAYNNDYQDNLEFWPEGTELEIDGKKVIAGNKTHKNPAGKERRGTGKVLLLASTYGMGGATAGERLKKTKEEGQQLLDNFFEKFKKVKEAIDDSKKFLLEHGYVEDWAGRRRHLPEIYLEDYSAQYKDKSKSLTNSFNPIISCTDRPQETEELKSYLKRANETKSSRDFEKLEKEADKNGIVLTSNKSKKAQAERQCFNARIQGGAASLTKLAMVNISNDKIMNDCNAHLIITVHDEVLVECPAYYEDIITERLPQIMIDSSKPYMNVPMKCDPYCVNRWYADEASAELLKEYKKYFNDKGLSKEESLEKLYENHTELPKSSIDDVISGKEDQLIF